MTAPIRSAIHRNTVPLIVATALFMQSLDATVLSTALPAIARDFDANPIHLKLAVTTYLLALAVFIPASSWVADRFGARPVFRAAMAVFALGSIGCALSDGLMELVAARALQGMGGAMMVPVGRIVVLRAIPKNELIGALAWLTMPALIGPVMGPPLGGFITTYFDWRYIFWINIPIAMIGMWLVTRFIPHGEPQDPGKFDLAGFLMLGPGLAAFLTGTTIAGLGLLDPISNALLTGTGAALIALYVRHALRDPAPIIDLRLLSIPTFRASVLGGLMFRIGIGAFPFLLPLLLQLGFGMTPFHSGLLTFASGAGALLMKVAAPGILRQFGYKRVLVMNAVFAAAFLAMPGLFTAATPWIVIVMSLLMGGFLRSLQFTAINSIAYADIGPEKLSRAAGFVAVLQELSGTIGVAVAALALETMQEMDGRAAVDASHFPAVFAGIAILAALSSMIFLRLPRDAGREMLSTERVKAPADPGL
jgi:EmrB/QacA subfamily drug resistance transporter